MMMMMIIIIIIIMQPTTTHETKVIMMVDIKTRNEIKTYQSWTTLTHHVFFHLRTKSRKTAVQ